MNEPTTTSTRPYLIRAIHEWCTDNGLTPYLSVRVDRSVQVPREFVNEGEIVLNVSYDATGSLQLGNELIEFKARFGGKPRDIMVPVERVQAIYARESGQGMSFPVVDDVLAVVPDEMLDVAGAVTWRRQKRLRLTSPRLHRWCSWSLPAPTRRWRRVTNHVLPRLRQAVPPSSG